MVTHASITHIEVISKNIVKAALKETALKSLQYGFLCRYHPYRTDIDRHTNIVIAPLFSTQLDATLIIFQYLNGIL